MHNASHQLHRSSTRRRSRHSQRRTDMVVGMAALAVASSLFCAACSGGDAETSDAAGTTAASTALATRAPASDVPDTLTPATDAPMTTAATDAASGSTMGDADADEPTASSSAPAAPIDPLDDLDEDGEIDERCATIDLGAGLVVETLCNTDLVPTPEVGVVPTAGSLLLLPSPARWDDLADVDATIRTATTVDGRRVVIYVLGSDTLFDSGSSTLRSTATPPLTAIVASVATRFPDAPISVRGAADSVGEPAANQTLSEQRAAAVATTLTGLGIDPARVSSIGLGEDVPAAEETSDLGRQVNRRVEIVVG